MGFSTRLQLTLMALGMTSAELVGIVKSFGRGGGVTIGMRWCRDSGRVRFWTGQVAATLVGSGH